MKKVAAYCRVSTDKDDQINSLESQKRYFEEYINRNEDWEFAGLYVDEGISGTNIKKRSGFKQMIADAEKNKFDIIITKEISRFARNTLDSIYYTRKLKSIGVAVIFMSDNINTLDPDSELRLTIMASIAQEESRKTSERVKWGQKRAMERGVVFGNRIYGFNVKDGKLYINEEEAKIIQLIFKLYYEDGMGTHVLCKELEDRGIPTPRGAKRWSNATILKILKNEKYIGTLKQRKELTTDFLTHSRKTNKGNEEFITKELNHEAIIDKKVFEDVQKEITRRNKYKEENTKYSNRYAWSGRIECGICDGKYKRRIWNYGKGCETVVWQCGTSMRYGAEKVNKAGDKVGCSSKSIHEVVLRQAFTSVLNEVLKNKDEIINNLEKAIFKVIEETNNNNQIKDIAAQIDKIKVKKEKLIDLYSDETISKSEFKDRNDEYNVRLEKLDENLRQIKALKEKYAEKRELSKRIKNTISKLAKAEDYSEEVCKELLNKIVVYNRNHFKIILNCNIEKDVYFQEEEYSDLSKTQYLRQKGQYKLQWRNFQ
ncbi:MAG: recombinase family protein [Ignavibacteriales bacterium]